MTTSTTFLICTLLLMNALELLLIAFAFDLYKKTRADYDAAVDALNNRKR